jgi:hypothetical protein
MQKSSNGAACGVLFVGAYSTKTNKMQSQKPALNGSVFAFCRTENWHPQ